MDYFYTLILETYKILFLLLPLLTAVAMIVWLDRRVWAFVQKRQGPNVVGPFGLLQSLADALKYIFKEIIIPYTPNDETAKIYKMPTLISARTLSTPKGITAQAIKAKVIVIIGARIKIILFELAGIIISLKIYLRASARDCNNPNGPTTFGPCLFWTHAQTLLSSQTIIATETKTGISKNKIL